MMAHDVTSVGGSPGRPVRSCRSGSRSDWLLKVAVAVMVIVVLGLVTAPVRLG